MEKQELINSLNKVNEIEKLFSSEDSGFMPNIKTIKNNPEFLSWKNELKYYLQKIKQESLIIETLDLLNNGFKNGFTDENDFNDLKAKLTFISFHLDDFIDDSIVKEKLKTLTKMKKGTVIKTAFDEYTLQKQIGLGGNGRVFLAYDINNTKVAIKFVERNISSNKLKRFKNEIHFCETHNHKNVVKVLDRGYAFLDETEYVFYVMPLYDKTLRNKINDGLSSEQAVKIFIGLLKGLSYAHEKGTIHRDIKPENIMFEKNSFEPIICDFGIAHFSQEELLTVVETHNGDRLANFQYAAPEQRIRGGKITEQTDIYALALILNEMFTGEIPQASDYKTIGSVDPEYKYLDEIFIELFKQNSVDRLYPEEKIFTEMKILAEKYMREEEKLRLQNVIDETIIPEEFNATIVNKRFRNNRLIFTLDCEISTDWFKIISSGSFGQHSVLLGYEPRHLNKEGKCEISIRLHKNETESNLRSIVNNVSEWIQATNIVYSSYLKKNILDDQRRKEESRKDEIEKLENENFVNDILSKI